MKKHRVLKGILLAAEAVVLIVLIGGLYVYGQLTERLSIVSEAPEVTLNDEGKISKGVIVTNEEVPRMTGYRTFALFGIDHRDQNEALSGENSDTMIICSINNDTQKVRLVSIYRDTLLNIGDDIYSKANAAYAYGGPQQAVNMLNMNLDLAITDYITIDFNALAEAVDALGGLSVPLSYAEIVHMNNYCVETAEETGKSYTPVELPEEEPEDQEEILGLYDLNGVQVTSYCRIRYTSSLDMGRTERQRRVIGLLATKAVSSGLPSASARVSVYFSYMPRRFAQSFSRAALSAASGLSFEALSSGRLLSSHTARPFAMRRRILSGSRTVPPPVAITQPSRSESSCASSFSWALNDSSPNSLKYCAIGIPKRFSSSSSMSIKGIPAFCASSLPVVVFPAEGIPVSTMLRVVFMSFSAHFSMSAGSRVFPVNSSSAAKA